MKDLIDRQAAIDALEEPPKVPDTWSDESAIGEREQWEKDVKALNSLPAAQPEQSWIPCSDDNPKADGRYLITGKMGTVYSLDFEDGRWYGGIKPVAWMPLPEPYKGGEQDG